VDDDDEDDAGVTILLGFRAAASRVFFFPLRCWGRVFQASFPSDPRWTLDKVGEKGEREREREAARSADLRGNEREKRRRTRTTTEISRRSAKDSTGTTREIAWNARRGRSTETLRASRKNRRNVVGCSLKAP